MYIILNYDLFMECNRNSFISTSGACDTFNNMFLQSTIFFDNNKKKFKLIPKLFMFNCFMTNYYVWLLFSFLTDTLKMCIFSNVQSIESLLMASLVDYSRNCTLRLMLILLHKCGRHEFDCWTIRGNRWHWSRLQLG